MPGIAGAGRLLLALWIVVAPATAPHAAEAPTLSAFAAEIGLRDVGAFVDAVERVRRTGRLPPRYVSKREAKAHGWRGGGLCEAWPGHAIGGDVFHNFGGRLPAAPGRIYREADLDETCASRGPKRLIFANDGLLYVTVDHYNSFARVP